MPRAISMAKVCRVKETGGIGTAIQAQTAVSAEKMLARTIFRTLMKNPPYL
jgi:hypothetical protein